MKYLVTLASGAVASAACFAAYIIVAPAETAVSSDVWSGTLEIRSGTAASAASAQEADFRGRTWDADALPRFRSNAFKALTIFVR